MCEENNELELEEKKQNLDEVFCSERTEFERLQKNSDTTDWSDFDYKDSLQHKGNSTVSIILVNTFYIRLVLAVVTEMST